MNFVDGLLYTKFANAAPSRWKQLVGCCLEHANYGVGEVVSADPRGGNPLLKVQFDDPAEALKFNIKAFLNGRINVQVPDDQSEPFRVWLREYELHKPELGTEKSPWAKETAQVKESLQRGERSRSRRFTVDPSKGALKTAPTSSEAKLELIGEQRRVLTLNPQNPVQIKGVAGSGKTTVAIFRARHLLKNYQSLFHPTSVAIFTFSKTLVRYLDHLVTDRPSSEEFDHTIKDLTVVNFHSWAWGFMAERGALEKVEVIKSGVQMSFVHRVLSHLRRVHPSERILEKSSAFFKDEFSWIKGKAVHDSREYQGISRVGRGGDRVTKNDRDLVWKVFESYQDELKQAKYIDFDDFALRCLELIESDPSFEPPFTHLVVDEAQDLTKAQMLVLGRLVSPVTNSITVIADAAQKIYKSGFTWREVGLNVVGGRTIEFKKNYRNTRAISEAARSLLSHDPDPSEFTEVEVGEREGSKPSLHKFVREASELEYLVSVASREISDGSRSVCIVHRTNAYVRKVGALLTKGGHEVEYLTGSESVDFDSKSIKLCTMTSIKGLQFDVVIIAGVSHGNLPLAIQEVEDREEHINTERRLLYTCMTRAKQSLRMTFSGAPSPFLDEIDSTLLIKSD